VTTQTTTTTADSRDNAYWPDEARLTAFAEQDVRTEQPDRADKTDRTLENNTEYAALYFVS
jgi:hypothetical protein